MEPNLDLKEQDYEYTTLMNMLKVSVSKHLLDEHFTLVWANPFYYGLIGYGREEYEALFHNQCDTYYVNEELGFHDEEELAGLADVVVKSLAEGRSGYSHTGRIRRKNGEYAWVKMTATFSDEYIDGHQVSYTVMTDITDSMRMQIEQSVTYDSLPGFVAKYRVGPQMQITLLNANARFFNIFGEGSLVIGEDDILFRKNFLANVDAIDKYRDQILAGEPVSLVVRVKDRQDKDTWLQVKASCVDRQSGEPVYLAVFIDITNETELRLMQEKLEKQAEELKSALKLAEYANRAKSDFLSHMSHDIRTPMNAIVGMTDIAKSHLGEPEKIRDCLNKITLSSQHLLGLINDVLDMSKIENGNIMISKSPLFLPELLADVVTITQPNIKARNQQFSVQLHNIRHERYCSDALRLRQILINLLSNASKFTPPEGMVCVDVEEMPEGEGPDSVLRISVADSGIGMSPEFLEHLFDPFSREQDSRVDKTEGSGLGMAITKRLVNLLGGNIEVSSRMGQGTIFSVTLPMEVDDAPPENCCFEDLKVLVVDDAEDTLEYLDQALREMGIQGECTASGADAVNRAVEAHKAGKDYDIIILDWKMPELNGLQTARQIRDQVDGGLPILIMSAYDWSEIEEDAHSAGITGFLQKPVFRSTLCYGIQKFVMKQKAAEAKAANYDFKKKRILLVEDNDLNREIASELLEQVGAVVDTAINGRLGVDKFRYSPEGYYSLILMDVQMPVMDGLTASRAIRSLQRGDADKIPIIAMTADAFAEDVAAARAAGMSDHIAKPIDIQQLYRLISSYIG